MKPKSKSRGPVPAPETPATARFGQISDNVWRISGKTMTIDEFIEEQARYVTSVDIGALSSFSSGLLDKLTEGNAIEYPELEEAVHLINQFLDSATARHAKDPLPRWMAETGFAAGYLLKRFDLIPDHVAGIGLADDALILQRVVARNRSDLVRCLEAPAAGNISIGLGWSATRGRV
jgi:uncharacterized membrane protein YkvA (DUF1232 family)